MYERNAIILERYFDQLFGYDKNYNIKTNFREYSDLVKYLEEYKNISEEEDGMAQDYDTIANRIREIQKTQENLSKKNNKLQEERNNLFQNIDDSSDTIRKRLSSINDDINSVNEEIVENTENFIKIVGEFNDKSSVRTSCERQRRSVENRYNRKLNEILDHYREIDIEKEKIAKSFIETDTENIEDELKRKINNNGVSEKIPFNEEVISKSICLGIDIQKRETEILANIYEKTNRLFNEIKNNNVRIEKHKRVIKDADSKIEFIEAIKEYLFQFLDNERLTAVNTEEEHSKLMKEACKNLDEDLVQINNLYTLLLKEISRKVTKKSYIELYKIDYLNELEKKAEDFDRQIKKLNLSVTIINPNYWRIEGMKKIYNVFYKSVTENYGRDLTEFISENEEEEVFEDNEEILEKEKQEEKVEITSEIKDNDDSKKEAQKKKKNDVKAELDKKIDMILGFDNDIVNKERSSDNLDDENILSDWDDDDWDDDLDSDLWDDEEDEEDNWPNKKDKSTDDDLDDPFEKEDDDWDLDLDDETNEYKIQSDDDEIESKEKINVDEDEDDERILKEDKNKEDDEEDWENQYVKMEKKGRHRKKKSFFDKFKK